MKKFFQIAGKAALVCFVVAMLAWPSYILFQSSQESKRNPLAEEKMITAALRTLANREIARRAADKNDPCYGIIQPINWEEEEEASVSDHTPTMPPGSGMFRGWVSVEDECGIQKASQLSLTLNGKAATLHSSEGNAEATAVLPPGDYTIRLASEKLPGEVSISCSGSGGVNPVTITAGHTTDCMMIYYVRR
jgi:hypothetical protein